MEIAGLFRRRGRPTAELLHPIDELRDAVHLPRYQSRQRTVAVARAAFEQLACPADGGQGVLDFMRQYGGGAQFDALIAILVHMAVIDGHIDDNADRAVDRHLLK